MRIGCTGHQGLTDATAENVVTELNSYFLSIDSLIGVSSLAEGADQLFAQSVIGSGGTLEVVIPCVGYESTFVTSDDLRRYEHLKSEATSTTQLDFSRPTEEAFWAAGRLIVQSSDALIAVWDGAKSRGLGGTADVVEYAQQLGKAVKVIWPTGSMRKL
ncbi:hypothetical protein [Aeromicrobium sp.]|uniref:hypothetical protein n=1 Tax=Aeromicrobium sp. TaxID=1871063 RepID=UPI002FCBDF86